MSNELMLLLVSAAAIGSVHTLLGPDHYLPFVALSKARGWSVTKTLWITGICGFGHVLSSVVLGFIGIAAGFTLKRLEVIESTRGELAGWFLLAFGMVYFTWGLVSAIRNKPHKHHHAHHDGEQHSHEHSHHGSHTHPHDSKSKSITPWVLFTIFLFGPCEPLIPLLMYPAASESIWATALVASVFSVVTILTMLSVVFMSIFGLSFISFERLSRYSHSFAGFTILMCGAAIQFGL